MSERRRGGGHILAVVAGGAGMFLGYVLGLALVPVIGDGAEAGAAAPTRPSLEDADTEALCEALAARSAEGAEPRSSLDQDRALAACLEIFDPAE